MSRLKIGFASGLNGVDPKAYNGWDGELYACCADSDSNAALYAQHGYEMDALLNEKATKDGFANKIERLANYCQAGDRVAITHSGHGSRYGSPLLGWHEYLCFWDGQMSDSHFLSLLAKFKPGVQVVVELDTCHSGGLSRGLGAVNGEMGRSRAMPRFVRDSLVPPPTPIDRSQIAASVVILSACRDDETALDGMANGAYTGSRLDARELFLNPPVLKAWFEATQSLMLRKFPQQHPVASLLGPEANNVWLSPL